VPAAQVDKVVQLSWLLDAENVPPAQVVQVRSAVAEPAFEIYVPATHVVLATQIVDGSPSLSHVPAAQGAAGCAPPWQYSPGVQASQTASLVEVAAVV
jgi:hypothetical protein